MTIGYTTGVYDLFHIGHLTLLKNAKGMCDKLIVGVTVDELVLYKGKHAMIPFSDRAEIVRSIKYVDAVVPQYDMDKLAACKPLVPLLSFDSTALLFLVASLLICITGSLSLAWLMTRWKWTNIFHLKQPKCQNTYKEDII